MIVGIGILSGSDLGRAISHTDLTAATHIVAERAG